MGCSSAIAGHPSPCPFPTLQQPAGTEALDGNPRMTNQGADSITNHQEKQQAPPEQKALN
jgi:hypothetical protein